MQAISDALASLSPTVRLLLFVALAVQLVVQIYSLIDLAKRPEVAGGRKWVWVLIIVAGNLLGALIYLVLGRREPLVEIATHAGERDARDRALDRLYGKSDRP
ncbi:MAG: PLD nuclease N-terminal domain-containing protein [Gemmatimonadales bacterium]